MSFKNLWKNRTVGFWIGFCGAVMALLGDVAFVLLDSGDRTFSWITFGLILAGALLEAGVVLTEWSVFPLLSAVCFGCGLSYHLYLGLPTLSDIWNGVNFIGGNATAVIVFGAIFLAAAAAGICSAFTEQRKPAIFVSEPS